MSYIISNSNSRNKITISTEEMPGKTIYYGHKLGVPDEMLSHILYYTHEKISGKFYFLDYKKWKDEYQMREIIPTMTKCWVNTTDNSKSLMESYNSLLRALEEMGGKFRKIYIIET